MERKKKKKRKKQRQALKTLNTERKTTKREKQYLENKLKAVLPVEFFTISRLRARILKLSGSVRLPVNRERNPLPAYNTDDNYQSINEMRKQFE